MPICRIAGDPRPPKGATVGGFDAVTLACRVHGLPLPEREQRFHATRKWRADYLWREQRVILEIDGGLYRGGRGGGTGVGGHSSVVGIRRDMAKGNAAQLAGWLFLRVTPEHVRNLEFLDLLRQAFGLRRC